MNNGNKTHFSTYVLRSIFNLLKLIMKLWFGSIHVNFYKLRLSSKPFDLFLKRKKKEKKKRYLDKMIKKSLSFLKKKSNQSTVIDHRNNQTKTLRWTHSSSSQPKWIRNLFHLKFRFWVEIHSWKQNNIKSLERKFYHLL